MIASPQDRCLECDYLLDGLPMPYRCPECGLAYDNETLVFRPKKLGWLYATTALILVIIVRLAFLYWNLLVSRLGTLLSVIFISLCAIVALIRAYRSIRRVINREQFVALTKQAVVAKTAKGGKQTLNFDQIAFVSIVDEHPWVQAKENRQGSSVAVSTPMKINLKGIFDNTEEMRVFKRVAEERRAADRC
jgi:hypothetical protein